MSHYGYYLHHQYITNSSTYCQRSVFMCFFMDLRMYSDYFPTPLL